MEPSLSFATTTESLYENSSASCAISPPVMGACPTGRATLKAEPISINGLNGRRSILRSTSPGRFSRELSGRPLRSETQMHSRTRSESWIGISTLPKDSSGTAHFFAAMISRSPVSNSATCSPRYFDLPTERPERDRLRAHHERLTGRPPYREHVMITYDELRVSGADRAFRPRPGLPPSGDRLGRRCEAT